MAKIPGKIPTNGRKIPPPGRWYLKNKGGRVQKY
jgi:hypothetical protein